MANYNFNKEDFKQKLCETIREYRTEAQERIAEKSELSVDGLSLIERGESLPNSYTLTKLANALNITPNHLLKDFITNKGLLYDELISFELDKLTESEKEFILYTIKFIRQNREARK